MIIIRQLAHRDLVVDHRLLDVLLLFAQYIHRVLRLPLEGREGLGDKGGRRDGDARGLALGSVRGAVVGIQHLLAEVRDIRDVVHCFGRQSDHKIELDGRISALKSDAAGVHQFVLKDVFVDRVAQALTARLGRKGQTALAYGFDLVEDIIGEAVYAQ